MPRVQQDPGSSLELGVEDFVTDEITGINLYTFSDRLKARLTEIGIGDQTQRPKLEEDHRGVFPGLKPGDYFNGRMPVVIRKLNLDQLSALYSLFTSWYSYLTFQTSVVAIERSESLKQKEFLWSHIRKLYKHTDDGTRNTDQAASDLARGDYRFARANARYAELNVLWEVMLATLEVTEQDMKMISREVTINQAKMAKDVMGSGFKERVMNSRPWSVNRGAQDAPEEASDGSEDQSASPKRPTVRIRRPGSG
jgi:hypothetical protein